MLTPLLRRGFEIKKTLLATRASGLAKKSGEVGGGGVVGENGLIFVSRETFREKREISIQNIKDKDMLCYDFVFKNRKRGFCRKRAPKPRKTTVFSLKNGKKCKLFNKFLLLRLCY